MSLITAEAAMTMSLIRGWKRSLKWIKSHQRHVTLLDTKAPTTRTSNPLVRFVTICCFEILCITTTTSSQVQTQSCSCDLTNQVGDESRWRVLKLKHERCSPTTLKTVWLSQNPLAWISSQRIGRWNLQCKILLGMRKNIYVQCLTSWWKYYFRTARWLAITPHVFITAWISLNASAICVTSYRHHTRLARMRNGRCNRFLKTII